MCLISAVWLGAVPALTEAAWEAVPEVSVGAFGMDNIFRSVDGQASGVRTVLDARATLSNFNERGAISLTPRLTTDTYADEEQKNLSSDDKYLSGLGQYEWQTATAGFGLDYSNASVLRAEFQNAIPEDPDIDDPAEGDTGRTGLAQQQRERMVIQGNVDFALFERDTLRLEYLGSEVAYSGIPVAFRSGYDYNEATVQLSRQVSDRTELFVGMSTALFEAERNDNETTSNAVQAGFSRLLSETWTLNLSAGVTKIEYEFIDDPMANRFIGDSGAPTFELFLRNRNPRSTWNFGLDHNLVPSSNGYLTERTRARVFLNERFTPRLTGRFGLLWTTFSPADAVDLQDERDYARLQVTFEWSMSETMLLSFGMDAIEQEFPNESSASAQSNSVFVGFIYRGLSRQN